MSNRGTPSKLSLQYKKLLKAKRANSPTTPTNNSTGVSPAPKRLGSGVIVIDSSDEDRKENIPKSKRSSTTFSLSSRRNSTILAGNLTILDSDDDETVHERVSILSRQPTNSLDNMSAKFKRPRQLASRKNLNNGENVKSALQDITENGEHDLLTEDETCFYSCDDTKSQDDPGLNQGLINTSLSSQQIRLTKSYTSNSSGLFRKEDNMIQERTESLKLALTETTFSEERQMNTLGIVIPSPQFQRTPTSPSSFTETGIVKSSQLFSLQKPVSVSQKIVLVDSSDSDDDRPILSKKLNFNKFNNRSESKNLSSDDELPPTNLPSPGARLLTNSKIQQVTSWLSEVSPRMSNDDASKERRIDTSLPSNQGLKTQMSYSDQSDLTSKGCWNSEVNSQATSKGEGKREFMDSHSNKIIDSSLDQPSQEISWARSSSNKIQSSISSQSLSSQPLSQGTSKAGGHSKISISSEALDQSVSQVTSKAGRSKEIFQPSISTESSFLGDDKVQQLNNQIYGASNLQSVQYNSDLCHQDISEHLIPLNSISINSVQSESVKVNFVFGNDSLDVIDHTIQNRTGVTRVNYSARTLSKTGGNNTIDNSVNAVRAWTSIQESEVQSGSASIKTFEEKVLRTAKCDSSSEDDNLDNFLINLKNSRPVLKKVSEDEDFIVPDNQVESSDNISPELSLEDRIRRRLDVKKPLSRRCKPSLKLSYSSSESENELPTPTARRKKNLIKKPSDESDSPTTRVTIDVKKKTVKEDVTKTSVDHGLIRSRITSPTPSTHKRKGATKKKIRSDSESRSLSPVLVLSNSDSDQKSTDKPIKPKSTLSSEFTTPKPVINKGKSKTHQLKEAELRGTPTTLTFLSSLTIDTPKYRCHPDALQYLGNFKKKKEELAQRLYHLYNKEIFEGCLPSDMEISWNIRLTKTAGLCYSKRYRNKFNVELRSSRIELSSKVIDSGDRLRDTLIHEMCHAASWIISGYRDGHGPLWRAWAEKAIERFPELPVIDRCHSYQIRTKYNYVCEKCGYTIGRHSKSLDTDRKVCGHCHGRFKLVVNASNVKKDLNPSRATTPKTPNAFAMFVKENYKIHKKPGVGHKDVMAILSAEFSKVKLSYEENLKCKK